MNAIMNLKIPLNEGNLTNGGPVSFSGRPLVYGVSWLVRSLYNSISDGRTNEMPAEVLELQRN